MSFLSFNIRFYVATVIGLVVLAGAVIGTAFLPHLFSARVAINAPSAGAADIQTLDTKLGLGDAPGPNGQHPASSAGALSAPAAARQTITSTPAGVGVAGCSLSFSVTPSVSASGITYAFVLQNAGKSSCEGASFSVYYDSNESFVSAAPKPSASNYYWKIGTLRAGAKYDVSIITKEGSGDAIHNEACATADNAPQDACVDSYPTSGGVAKNAAAATSPAAGATASGSSYPVPAGKEFGVWVWDYPDQLTAAQAENLLEQAKEAGMNAVYITVDDYLNIFSLPAGASKNAKTANYFSALNRFIVDAHTLGIAVDVEGGARDWAEPQNTWKGYALISMVAQYNAQYPNAKIRALQYDVESYLLPQYASDQAGVLTQFVAFIDESASRMKSVDAGFSVVIPHFYDSTQAWTPEIPYDGVTAYPYTQLFSVLAQKQNSTLIIMAYRNFFTGSDGVQELASPELQETSSGGSATRVIIAQETGNVQPGYVTYYGESRADFFSGLSAIYDGFSNYSAFAGTAVDYIDPFLALK
ncbi:MAG: hypothetical protein ACREGH_02930 [Minisyncoccia bacterium]